jgi:hypothetical protein
MLRHNAQYDTEVKYCTISLYCKLWKCVSVSTKNNTVLNNFLKMHYNVSSS